MKKLFILILFTFLVNLVFGQQRSFSERYFDERYISSLAFLNPVIVNPGATAFDKDHHLLLNYRNKWASFPGSPKSIILSYDGPVADRLGFGALLATDSNGGLETTKVQGSLSYNLDTPTNKLGFGLAGEYIQHGLTGDVLSGGNIDVLDPTVLDRLEGTNFFDVSFGVFGLYNQKLTYGIAVPSLISSRIDTDDSDASREIGYLFNVGYIFNELSSDIVVEPSLYIKKLMNVPFHADINLLGRFLDDKLRSGITYTVGADEKIGFLIGFAVNTLNFTYSYNASRLEFQTYNNGSHELSVRIDIGKNKVKEEVMNMEAGSMEQKMMNKTTIGK